MSLFGLGKKKEEVKVEPACACNGEVATYEASSCCCGGQQVEMSWHRARSSTNRCSSACLTVSLKSDRFSVQRNITRNVI